MAGTKRIIVGDITQGNLKGKALADALAAGLCKMPEVPKRKN